MALAQAAERLGYQRFWLAEHHGMPGIASAATSVLIGHVAGKTQTIRVGSGGIMLPNHSPLVIAEQFGTLDALYPGRIDLGLGRAPGSDLATARAMRRDPHEAGARFPADVQELQSYFLGDGPVRAVPGNGANVPIWILGSSLFGAQLAAQLGLPFAFASHFAPEALMQAIEIYRTRFQPSAQLDKPYVMLGFAAIAADSNDEAQLIASSLYQTFINLSMGRPARLQSPVADYLDQLSPIARAQLQQRLACSAIGSRDTVMKATRAFLDKTGADELMLTGHIFNITARLRSIEIMAEVHAALFADKAA